jgi:hypothetical protein
MVRKEKLQAPTFTVFNMVMDSTCIDVALFFLETDVNFGSTVVASAKRVQCSNKPGNFAKKLEGIPQLKIPFRVPKRKAIGDMFLGSLWGHR